jgi:hypothetical protein
MPPGARREAVGSALLARAGVDAWRSRVDDGSRLNPVVEGVMCRWVSVVALAALVSGCSKPPATAPEPPPVPELNAEFVYIFVPDVWGGGGGGWGWSAREAGGPANAGMPRPVREAGAAGEADWPIIAGVGSTLGLRYSFTGAFENVRVDFYVDDALLGTRLWSGTTTGRQWGALLSPVWTPPDTGQYTIHAVMDPANRFAEGDESNNATSLTLHVRRGDLAAGVNGFVQWREGQWHAVMQARAGEPVWVVVSSLGFGRFENVRSVLDVSGAVLDDRRRTLSGGAYAHVESDTVQFIPPAPGAYAFTIRIDPDDEFLEHSETNNANEVTLNVVP